MFCSSYLKVLKFIYLTVSQSIPSGTIPTLGNPGHLTKSHARGTRICPHKLSRRGWEVEKEKNQLIPGLPYIAFSVSRQSMTQNFVSVLRTVKYPVPWKSILTGKVGTDEKIARASHFLLHQRVFSASFSTL